MRTLRLISANEIRLLGSDPFPILLLIAMPAVLLAFLARGLVGGPAHSVPAVAALFGYFGLSSIGFAFYREHGWHTWDRLRTLPLRSLTVVVGKALPLAALFAVQLGVLLGLGKLVYGMPWHGSIGAGVIVVLATVSIEVSLGLLLVSVCSTVVQLNAVASLGALILAGLGGALSPLTTLPDWARHLAPISPVYWSLEGFRGVISGRGGWESVAKPVAVLIGMAVVCLVATVIRFRTDEAKTSFA